MDIGELINRECTLGARVLELGDRLESLEKLARRTPPRTMLAERKKVEEAKTAVESLRTELRSTLAEHAELRTLLGRHDSGLSERYLAVRAAHS